jgi:hypothetical protein
MYSFVRQRLRYEDYLRPLTDIVPQGGTKSVSSHSIMFLTFARNEKAESQNQFKYYV